MNLKKYEEVKYEANKLEKDINKGYKFFSKVSIGMTIIALIISIACMKLGIENEALILENTELNKAIEMKNSQIADLEENCKDLFIENQELKFGGN